MNKALLPSLLGLLLLLCTQLPAQNTCFQSWRYVYNIPIFNPNGVPQTDFQVRLDLNTQALIQAGKMNPDGSDIRFVGDDCCASLHYWIQSGINTANTTIWIKMSSLGAFGSSPSLTMYYGNSGATTNLSAIDSVLASTGFDTSSTMQTVAAPIDTIVSFQSIAIPIDGRTVRWQLFSQGAGDIQLKMFDDTNKVNQTSPLFSLPAGPATTLIDWEAVSVPGAHVGFYTNDALGILTPCAPVTPCPGSCGDVAFEAGNQFEPAGQVDQITCGVLPNIKIWYRKFLFIDPTLQTGTEIDRTVTFNAAPGGTTTFCIGDSVRLTANDIGAPNYQWYTNGVLLPGATDTVYMALDSGHFYCVASWANNCQSITSDTVAVVAITPLVDLGPDRVVCSDSGVVLDAGAGFTSYLWSDNSTLQTLQVDTSGTYSVQVTDTNSCTFGDTVTLTIQPLPNPVIVPSGPITLCPGATVTLESFDPNWFAYQWNVNGETSSNLTVDTAGTFFVTVFDSLNCAGTSDPVTVNLAAQPVVDLGADTTICGSDSLTLSVSMVWDSVLWSDMSMGNSITVGLPGGYNVQVTDTNGCVAVDTIIVSVDTVPVPDIGGDLTVCPGATAALTAPAGFAVYDWSTGETQASINAGAGTYQVVVTDGNGCQGGSNLVMVSEFPELAVPTVTGGQALLTSSEAPNYQWFFEGTALTNETNRTLVPSEPGNYRVEVTDPNGCGTVSSADILVIFGIMPEDVPQGFSPNGDGINETFTILNIELFPQSTMTILNRWGSEVFQASPYLNRFNGNSVNGNRLPDGTYFYILDPGNGDDPISGYVIINR
ncbi:MAG: DUF2341 domain-containing protein [Bacteroidota bacterium]